MYVSTVEVKVIQDSNTNNVSVYSLSTTNVRFLEKFQTLVYSNVFSPSPG